MNWTQAIERKTRELTDIVTLLANMVALCAHRLDILWILTPAESAVRRLVWLVMTHQLKETITLSPSKPMTKEQAKALKAITSNPDRLPSFPLIDPRKTFDERGWQTAGPIPRIWTLGMERYVKPVKPEPSYEPLQRRIDALMNVLDDLPKHARRMGKIVAKRTSPERTWGDDAGRTLRQGRSASPGDKESPAQDSGPTKKRINRYRNLPLRPGLPPGWRQPEKRSWRGGREVQTARIYRHEIDAILHDCQALIHSIEHPPPFVFTGWATQAPRRT